MAKKYKASYPRLLQGMLEFGSVPEHFMAEIGISKRIFESWCEKHPKFQEAYDIGKEASKAKFISKVSNAAWRPEVFRVNNAMVNLLAINCHSMVRNSEKQEIKSEVQTEVKDTTAVPDWISEGVKLKKKK